MFNITACRNTFWSEETWNIAIPQLERKDSTEERGLTWKYREWGGFVSLVTESSQETPYLFQHIVNLSP